ncbi:MAG: glycosyltransferase family 4 protein [Spirulinaceae cyanobacterium]
MRIAQVSPLFERVPPPGYGGIELVVGHLTDELVRRGHEVTLFASGDSQTLAHLEATVKQATRLDPSIQEYTPYEMLQLARVQELASEFDIIHFHTGITALPIAHLLKTPVVHTLHGRFTPDNCKIFEYFRSQPFISISNAQRYDGPQLNYTGTVYNGIAVADYQFIEKPHDPPYLAFLGRMSPVKGPDRAIAIAKAVGLPLKMAGKVDPIDREFFEREVAPHIDNEQIIYLGELGHAQKADFLGHARATLFPITWPEPFGLVMIESMASGTPVIGINCGSVPEVIAHGKTGLICDTVEDAIAQLPKALEFDRRHCREYVERFFSIKTMVDSYEAAYQQILEPMRLRAA